MNSTILTATIVSRDVIRSTPGGVAALNLKLLHQSVQTENGHPVEVEIQLNAIAFGEVATGLDSTRAGDAISVKGFLSRKSRMSDAAVLHITQFKLS
ncbi:MAG TPA: primosomal replication protein N [Usitatibacteraceae bacterium]|nr:primosomal replication protein N [Usitatibacteraceae bacterium]